MKPIRLIEAIAGAAFAAAVLWACVVMAQEPGGGNGPTVDTGPAVEEPYAIIKGNGTGPCPQGLSAEAFERWWTRAGDAMWVGPEACGATVTVNELIDYRGIVLHTGGRWPCRIEFIYSGPSSGAAVDVWPWYGETIRGECPSKYGDPVKFDDEWWLQLRKTEVRTGDSIVLSWDGNRWRIEKCVGEWTRWRRHSSAGTERGP